MQIDNLPDMDVTHLTLRVRGEPALIKVFDPPVSAQEAKAWLDQNVIVQYESRNSVEIDSVHRDAE